MTSTHRWPPAALTLFLVLSLPALAAGQDDAAIVSADLPDRMAPGDRYRATVTVRNTGTSDWTHPDFKLGCVDDSDPLKRGDVRVWLRPGDVVRPGATHTFEIELEAPAAEGKHVTDWRMVHEGVRWFGEVAGKRVQVVRSGPAAPAPAPAPPSPPPPPPSAGQGRDAATIVQVDLPRELTPGSSYDAAITVRNDGTTTWDDGYRLGAVGDDDPLTRDCRVFLAPGTQVAPGASHTFRVTLTAPRQPGVYLTDWRMVHEHVEWFGGVARQRVRVPAQVGPQSDDDARLISVDLPDRMIAGRTATASITVENTGLSAWDRDFRLGTVDDSDPFHPDTREYLPAGTSVPPGGRHTFSFRLQAPAQPGTYVSDWRMVHEGVRWFGATARRVITVEPAPPAPPGPPTAHRTGRVRLEGNSLADDQGKFNALGATLFWAAWGYQNDRPRLERTLEFLSRNGYHFFRALGVVGDPNGPDGWDGREIRWRDADYRQTIAGLTDLAYDRYGLRIEWTLIGDGQVSIPDSRDRYQLVDWFLAMSRGREHKILHFEIANEHWQNGFPGDAGVDELRALTRYMNDRTDVLVAASAPGHTDQEVQQVYQGGVADLATIHFDRDVSKTEGHWRPVRKPWEHTYIAGVPVGSNNEPIGPGASVNSENDPVRLVSAVIVTHVSNIPIHVFHSRAGVRGDVDLWDMPGADRFGHLAALIPGDLASWERQNAHWRDAPFRAFARDASGRLHPDTMWPDHGRGATGAVRVYSGVRGNEFFTIAFGIQGRLTLEARRDLDLEVVDPMTGDVLERRFAPANQPFDLQGAEAFVLRGRYR